LVLISGSYAIAIRGYLNSSIFAFRSLRYSTIVAGSEAFGSSNEIFNCLVLGNNLKKAGKSSSVQTGVLFLITEESLAS